MRTVLLLCVKLSKLFLQELAVVILLLCDYIICTAVFSIPELLHYLVIKIKIKI